MKIGFIGIGQMGSAMAANLLKAGLEVTVYNRTAEKAKALADKGAKVATTIAGACKGDAVITMLANDDALESVVYEEGGLLASLGRRALHISSSTISVALAERLASDHAAVGQRFVGAPVIGRPDAAAAARIFIIAAGASEAIADSTPVFDAIGQRTFVVSDTPKAANLVKLSVNFLIGAVIESVGEAMALVEKGGIDKHAYLDVLISTLFSAPVYEIYGPLIAGDKFEPASFPAPLGQKDIRLALAASEDLRVPMPLASLLRDRLLTLLAQGGENLDWSAIGALAAKDAGKR
ncbi:NAD(P)-dependent oxidoreductase [Rhizobium sp. BK251]|uniref:NAD(P)-dependent oxidoreductase n=1 Tax=Rhizobium sp. BK251 TaxID=2512125 RepID=UPI00105067E3|nr:NAD(P)-dependent oxidoreductase [Rhizobium sp. BK251]TCL71102.1 3-hydroxyisobutyrate dehydrogenase-like beta-hydroxyacid dehydrogenase [Rhizobium sp. BK251]